MTFARALRSILRQDPDVIMVGEIRDEETARVAVQAALTGHLVLATLHTNDAPGAVSRLLDMGLEAYLLSSALNGVVAQRLVRTICASCTTKYYPSARGARRTRASADRAGRAFNKGAGCLECHNSGFRGRVGIYEVMEVTDADPASSIHVRGADPPESTTRSAEKASAHASRGGRVALALCGQDEPRGGPAGDSHRRPTTATSSRPVRRPAGRGKRHEIRIQARSTRRARQTTPRSRRGRRPRRARSSASRASTSRPSPKTAGGRAPPAPRRRHDGAGTHRQGPRALVTTALRARQVRHTARPGPRRDRATRRPEGPWREMLEQLRAKVGVGHGVVGGDGRASGDLRRRLPQPRGGRRDAPASSDAMLDRLVHCSSASSSRSGAR